MTTFLIFIAGVVLGFEIGRRASAPAPVAPQNREQREEKEERKRKVLALIAERGEIRNADAESLLGVSDASATRYLDELQAEGKIAQAGDTGRGVSYRLK